MIAALFLVWLQMSAPAQLDPNYYWCDAVCVNQFAEAAQRAADETDGKPCDGTHDCMDANGNGYQVMQGKPAEPVDVPAVQEPREVIKTNDCNVCFNNTCTAMACLPHKATDNVTTCADKSRILEHDENSPPRYWCRKVQP